MLRACVLSALLLSFAGDASAQVMDPPVVVDSFERARSQGKVDLALGYFADDATVTLPVRRSINVSGRTLPSQAPGAPTFTGKNEIRRFLDTFMAGPQPLITTNRHVVGNTVTWNERDQGQRPIDVTVQAVVQDGKIKSLTYSPAIITPASPPAAQATARLGAPIATAGLALLALSLLAVASLAPRRHPSASTLRGKLVTSLGQWRVAAKSD